MKKIILLLLVMVLTLSNDINAQVATDFNNESLISSKGQFVKDYSTQIDFEIPAKNIDNLLVMEKQELSQSNEAKPFRLAVPVSIDLNIPKLINWTQEKEFVYGKFVIKLNKALSASINFDQFYLPMNTEIFIYNENGSMITGAITEKENNLNNSWGSWVYQGEYIIIEIKTPITTINQLLLHSNNVAYGYKEIYKSIKVGGFGQSGSCNINIICPLGNGFEGERNSVSTILSANGGEFCTGSLIMNTCGTNQPYYLTANHCFVANSDTSGWRFAFQAWSTTCPLPGVNTNGVIYNGSTLRARNAASDFCLVELNSTPPVNSGIHYTGWSRSSVPATTSTAIHHPRGDLMKISRANNPVTVGSFGGTTNQHWTANWSPQNNGAGQTVTPVTEPGSSGSPLFDQNHRIIGQLHGGPSACGGSQLWDFYGRFDLSWDGGGSDATRLSNWLDPANTAAITTNTTNINNLTGTNVAFQISGNSIICNSETYLAPVGGTSYNWTITEGASLVTLTGNGTASITLTAIPYLSGQVTLYLTMGNNCGNMIGTKNVWVGVPQFNVVRDATQNESCDTKFHYVPFYINTPPNSAIEILFLSPQVTYTVGSNNLYTFKFPKGYSGPFEYIISSTNTCGTYIYDSVDMGDSNMISNCNSMGLLANTNLYKIYPNPTNNVINVSLADENEKPITTSKIIAELYDFSGQSKQKVEVKNNTASISVVGLQKGVYILNINIDGKTEGHQIIIE
jgi:lysyl endopeptidase